MKYMKRNLCVLSCSVAGIWSKEEEEEHKIKPTIVINLHPIKTSKLYSFLLC